MTSTAPSPDVAAVIASTQSVCTEVGELNRRWADLKTVDDARLAYKAALATEDRAFEVLEQDRAALETEQRRRRLAISTAGKPAPPPPQLPPIRINRVSPPIRTETPMAERPASPATADRRKLKKIFSRWQFTWEINPSIVAQINSIADNPERPVGEALALLDLRVFETPIPGESDIDWIARLQEWKGALDTYADHVRAEIQKLENQHASMIAIWERWRRSRDDETALVDWDLFIGKARAERQTRIDSLSADVRRMREELGL